MKSVMVALPVALLLLVAAVEPSVAGEPETD